MYKYNLLSPLVLHMRPPSLPLPPPSFFFFLRLEDNLEKLVLSFHHVSAGEITLRSSGLVTSISTLAGSLSFLKQGLIYRWVQ